MFQCGHCHEKLMKFENVFSKIGIVSDDCKILLNVFSNKYSHKKFNSRPMSVFVVFPFSVFEGRVVSHRLLSNYFFMQSVETDKLLITTYIFCLSSDGNAFIK